MSILIKGGRILDPATETDAVMDLLVDEEGRIEKVDKKIKADPNEVIDAEGCFVMPGLVDLHEHLRDPGQTEKEDLLSGSRAAMHGGYTTILAMPNTVPVVDHPDVLNYVKNKSVTCPIHVLQAGCITKGMQGKELSDIEGLVRAGAPAISEDGKSVMNAALYRKALEIAAMLDIPVLAHCEDANLAGNGVMNKDRNTKRLGLPGISNATEDVIISRDVMLAGDTGAKLHLCHCSTKNSSWIIEHAKLIGIRVTAEVTPHHFTLCSDDMKEADPCYKMNPPLRTLADVEVLREGLKSGIYDVIATDHAPHTFEEKNTSFLRAPFGIIGSETAAALTYTELVLQDYLTPLQMAEKMSYNPARILGIPAGTLKEGVAADICIFDPRPKVTIRKEDFYSKSCNTPFIGKTVQGCVAYTICGGKIVYRKG